jgi:hypothetical protein
MPEDRYRFTAKDEDRVRAAVASAVMRRRPSAVIAADLLHFASVGLDAAGWPNPSERERGFVYDVAATCMAAREETNAR